MANVITDYQENNNPEADVNIDVQAQAPVNAPAPEELEPVIDEPVTENLEDNQAIIDNQAAEPQPVPQADTQPVETIGDLMPDSFFEPEIGLQQIGGTVHPAYYENKNTFQDTIRQTKSWTDFNIRTTQEHRDKITDVQLNNQRINLNREKLRNLPENKQRLNLDGSKPVTDRISEFGNIAPQEQEKTVAESISDVLGSVFYMQNPETDISDTPAYFKFDDGREFAPFGGFDEYLTTWKESPGQAVLSLFPQIFNPVGSAFTAFNGSKWGDYPNGLIGGILYTLDGITNNWWVAGGQDIVDRINGVDRSGGSSLVQAFKGRDYTFSGIRRTDEQGNIENPASLFAGASPEPTTIGELRARNWLWKAVTPAPVPDETAFSPIKNVVGILEFGTGLIVDTAVDATVSAAVGAAAGSVIPGVGTVAGGIAGGVAGAATSIATKLDDVGDFIKAGLKVADDIPITKLDDITIPTVPSVYNFGEAAIIKANPTAPATIGNLPSVVIPDAPSVQFIPYLDGDTIVRTPLATLPNNLEDAGSVIVNPRIFAEQTELVKIPDVLEPLEDIDVNSYYKYTAKQTSDLKAKLTQEKEIIDNYSNQLDDIIDENLGYEVGRQSLIRGVEPIVELPVREGTTLLPTGNKFVEGVELYHGTRNLDTAFENANPIVGAARSEAGIGIHFTNSQDLARSYASSPQQYNLPPTSSRIPTDVGTVTKVSIAPESNLMNGSVKLPNAIKEQVKLNTKSMGQLNLGYQDDVLDELVDKAVDSATNYKSLIGKLDDAVATWGKRMGYDAFPEEVALNVQRSVADNLRSLGVDGVVFKTGDSIQTTIINPRVIKASGSEQISGLSVLEQIANRSNADNISSKLFPDSAFARQNAIDSQYQLANQKMFETSQQLKKSNENLDQIATELGVRGKSADELNDSRKASEAATLEAKHADVNQRRIKLEESRRVANEKAPKPLPKKRKGIARTSDIDTRVQRLRRLMTEASTQQNKLADVVRAQANQIGGLIDTRLSLYADDIINLNTTRIGAMETWLATQFNMKHETLNLLTRSGAGKLRENVRNAGLVAEGIVDDMVRLTHLKTLRQHDELVKGLLKGRTSPEVVSKLRTDIIELGAIPKLETKYGLMPGARAANRGRYEKLLDELRNVGLNDTEIHRVIQSAQDVSASMDEARLIGNSLGLDIGNEQVIGYMSRILSPEAKSWLAKLDAQKKFSIEQGAGFGSNTKVAIQKSRNHFRYIPEDTEVVGFQLGLPVAEVNRMINSGEFPEFIRKVGNQNPELLDEMLEVGSLSKLPMTTNELAEHMVDLLGDELPAALRKDLFLTDPVANFNKYTEYLKSATAQSRIVKNVVSDGLEFGWALPKVEFQKLDASDAKEFIEWTEDKVKTFLPTYRNSGESVYVHRAVHNQFVSMTGFINNPATMHTTANAFSMINKAMNQAILMNPGYAPRIFYDSFRSFVSGGGNALRFAEGHMDLMKVLRGRNLDHFDSTAKVYKGMRGELVTEKQLFQAFLATQGTDFIPLTTGSRLRAGVNLGQVFNLKHGTYYAIQFGRQFGLPAGVKKGFASLRDTQSEVFSKIATMGAWFESSAKWALYKSWLDTRKGNKVGQFATQFGARYPEINNVRDAQKLMEDYFTSWSDVGIGTKRFNAIRPFASYAIWNTPAQIRQMFRRPREFVNYMKIRSFINRDMAMDSENNEWSFPSFVLDNKGIGLWKDTDGNWVTMIPTNWDSRSDFLMGANRTSKQQLKDMGYFVGTTEEQIKQITQEDSDFDLLGDFFQSASPLIKTSVALLTGKDPLTGRNIKDPDSTLGKKTGLNWQTEYLLSTYPPLGAVIRSNPGNVLGVPEIVDSKTGQVISPSKPGLLGNRRIEYDTSKYKDPWGMVNVMRRIGFNVKVIDRNKNLNWTFKKLDKAVGVVKSDIRSLEKEIADMRLKGEDNKFPTEFQEKQKRLRTAASQLPWLIKDKIALSIYLREKGVTNTTELRKVRSKALDQIIKTYGGEITQQLLDELQPFEDTILDSTKEEENK